jgi:hypothetical protein
MYSKGMLNRTIVSNWIDISRGIVMKRGIVKSALVLIVGLGFLSVEQAMNASSTLPRAGAQGARAGQEAMWRGTQAVRTPTLRSAGRLFTQPTTPTVSPRFTRSMSTRPSLSQSRELSTSPQPKQVGRIRQRLNAEGQSGTEQSSSWWKWLLGGGATAAGAAGLAKSGEEVEQEPSTTGMSIDEKEAVKFETYLKKRNKLWAQCLNEHNNDIWYCRWVEEEKAGFAGIKSIQSYMIDLEELGLAKQFVERFKQLSPDLADIRAQYLRKRAKEQLEWAIKQDWFHEIKDDSDFNRVLEKMEGMTHTVYGFDKDNWSKLVREITRMLDRKNSDDAAWFLLNRLTPYPAHSRKMIVAKPKGYN